MVELAEIQAARERLGSHVRRTPLIRSIGLRNAPAGRLSLKLESLQVTGSFKARGATNKVLSLLPGQMGKGLVTASGGNHGLGVAYAGWLAKVPATIFLPLDAPRAKIARFELWGAEVVLEGSVWDEADRAAREVAERKGLTYVHAFADPAVIAGQGTIGLEILEDAPETDVVLVAIGGGGLISGVGTAMKSLAPGLRVIGVEPVGAPTLYESMRAGAVVELEGIATAASSLAPRKSAELNLRIIQETVEQIVLVSDEEMREAARWLWLELGIAAELSGAAAVAAWLSGKVRVGEGENVCALVCGAGTEGVG